MDRTCGRCPAAARSVVGGMEDHIVVGDRVLLDVSFSAARGRLGVLARDVMLTCLSEVAYGEGITDLVQVAGPAAGLTGWPGHA